MYFLYYIDRICNFYNKILEYTYPYKKIIINQADYSLKFNLYLFNLYHNVVLNEKQKIILNYNNTNIICIESNSFKDLHEQLKNAHDIKSVFKHFNLWIQYCSNTQETDVTNYFHLSAFNSKNVSFNDICILANLKNITTIKIVRFVDGKVIKKKLDYELYANTKIDFINNDLV